MVPLSIALVPDMNPLTAGIEALEGRVRGGVWRGGRWGKWAEEGSGNGYDSLELIFQNNIASSE